MFGALGAGRLAGANVLDGYAGSGALGIEALSRGAARATLVDRDPRAVDAIRRNLASTAPRRPGHGPPAGRRRLPRRSRRRMSRSTWSSATRPTTWPGPSSPGSSRRWPSPGWLAPDGERGGRAVGRRRVRRRSRGMASHVVAGLRGYARRARRPGCRGPDGLTPPQVTFVGGPDRRTADLQTRSVPHRGHRTLPGFVRPGHPRSSRHHRADRPALRRRHRRGHPQPAEVAVAVHPRGAPGHAPRGDRAPRRTSRSSSSRACSSTSPATTARPRS